MRERTPFPKELIDKLPELKLLITTGMVNRGIDVEAAKAKGITVCGTRQLRQSDRRSSPGAISSS